MEKIKVGIAWGGYSSEKLISKMSCDSIYDILKKKYLNLYKIEFSKKQWIVSDSNNKKFIINKNDFSFIKNGLKSPYSQGKAIPSDKRDKVHLDDENTVIIRKGTTDTYWQDNDLNQDWPEILKGTEKDAYPGLTASKKHPKKLCVPCCFKKPSKDFDPTIDEIQRILRPNGFDKCAGNFLDEDFDDVKDKKKYLNQKIVMIKVKI